MLRQPKAIALLTELKEKREPQTINISLLWSETTQKTQPRLSCNF
jgi:hypothetical protein